MFLTMPWMTLCSKAIAGPYLKMCVRIWRLKRLQKKGHSHGSSSSKGIQKSFNVVQWIALVVQITAIWILTTLAHGSSRCTRLSIRHNFLSSGSATKLTLWSWRGSRKPGFDWGSGQDELGLEDSIGCLDSISHGLRSIRLDCQSTSAIVS